MLTMGAIPNQTEKMDMMMIFMGLSNLNGLKLAYDAVLILAMTVLPSVNAPGILHRMTMQPCNVPR